MNIHPKPALPCLNMKGCWLEEAGLRMNTMVTVEVERGELVIHSTQ